MSDNKNGNSNLSRESYDKLINLNQSKLKIWDKNFRDSDLDAFHKVVLSETPDECSSAMLLGSMFCEAVLEPHIWREKRGHWDMIMSKADKQRFKMMTEKFNIDKTMQCLLTNTQLLREFSYWGEFEGTPLKARLDMVHKESRKIFELKTTYSINQFSWTYKKFGYEIQAGFYSLLFELVHGVPVNKYYVLIQESHAPYGTASIEVSGVALKENVNKVKQLIRDYGTWSDSFLEKKEELENKKKKEHLKKLKVNKKGVVNEL